jgi:hypothetical protein
VYFSKLPRVGLFGHNTGCVCEGWRLIFDALRLARIQSSPQFSLLREFMTA